MTDVYWLLATPWDPVAAAAATVRATTTDLSAIVLFGGYEWLPVMDGGHASSESVFDGSFTGNVDSTRGQVALITGMLELDPWANYVWAGRPVQIYKGTIDTSGPLPIWPTSQTLVFDGIAQSFDPDAATIFLSVNLPSGRVANATYAGTGGIEGPSSLAGTTKPYVAGIVKNQPVVLVDPGKLLFQLHGYGTIGGIYTYREKGVVLDQAQVAHSTFADLYAAVVPATEIHYHNDSGSFRIGFSPVGDITVDGNGAQPGATFSASVGELVRQMVVRSGWSTAKIDYDSINFVNTSLNYPVRYVDDAGQDILDAMSGLMLGSGGYWGVDDLGVFYLGLIQLAAAADFSVGDEGLGTYDIVESDYLPKRAPFWRQRVGWGFNPEVLTFADTEFADWSDITDDDGTKPVDSATRNDDGGNLFSSPILLDQATFLNGAFRYPISGTWYVALQTPNALAKWDIPVGNLTPGETLWLRYTLISDGGTSETCNSSVVWYRADGSAYAQNLSSTTARTLAAAVPGLTITVPVQVPSDAKACSFYVERPAATGYTFYASSPLLTRHQPGADVTAGATSADTAAVAGVPAVAVNNNIAVAQALASSASSTATSADAFRLDVQDGGKFSKDEKKRYLNLINGWVTDIPALVTKGYALGLNAQAAALNTAWTNFYNYLVANHYSDLTSSDSISRSTFNASEGAFSAALTALSNAAKGMSALSHANALYNGSFKLAFTGWSNPGFGYAVDWRGRIVWAPAGTGGTAVMTSTNPINTVPGEPITLSATFSGSATTLGFMFVDIQWCNGGNGATIAYSSGSANGVTLYNETQDTIRRVQTMTVPATTDGSGFVRGYVRVVDISDIARPSAVRTCQLIKVERNSSPTAFSDEATDGANHAASFGRIGSGRANLPTNFSVGLTALVSTAYSPTQTNAGSSVTANLPAVSYTLDTGDTISYPSGSVPGLAYSATYYFYRNDPNLDGGTSYGASTSLTDAMGPNKNYLGYLTTMSSAGAGGGGGGGARGGAGQNCPSLDMIVATDRGDVAARELAGTQRLRVLAPDFETLAWEAMQSAECVAAEPCVRIVTQNGCAVVVSAATPLTTRSRRWCRAINARMAELPTRVVEDGAERMEWSRVAYVEDAGSRPVARIRCHHATFAAGEAADRMVLTHNPYK